MSFSAFEWVAQASTPLALVLDLGEGAGFDREQVVNAIATELDRSVAVAVQESAAETLVHIKDALATHRSANLPTEPKDRLKHIVWLASSLCNDQVTAFAPTVDEPLTPVQPDPLPPKTTTLEPEPTVTVLHTASNQGAAATVAASTRVETLSTDSNWAIAISMGPILVPSDVNRRLKYPTSTIGSMEFAF